MADWGRALASGFVGACVLTLLNESVRRVLPDAPRVERLGMRGIAKLIGAAGETPPPDDDLYRLALAGDLVSNSLYYATAAVGDEAGVWARGTLLGLAAGVGAVYLPGPLGLGEGPSARTPATQAMTVAWYTAGGLAAAAAATFLARSNPGDYAAA